MRGQASRHDPGEQHRSVRFDTMSTRPLYEDDADFHKCIAKLIDAGHSAKTQWEVDTGVKAAGAPCGNAASPVGDAAGKTTQHEHEPNSETSLRGQSVEHQTYVVEVDVDDQEVMAVGDWKERTIDIILDSGCCRHVMPPSEVTGYVVRESPGSRRGQNFIVGNGEPVPNEGQVQLNLEVDVGGGNTRPITSVFQVAELSCSLMSVSQICDHGYQCVFDKEGAKVLGDDGEIVCRFKRDRNMYVTQMGLKAPTPFGRPER